MAQLRILITDEVQKTISQELTEKYGYDTRTWWVHNCFQDCKFFGVGADSYVIFPTEDALIMFMLKYGAR